MTNVIELAAGLAAIGKTEEQLAAERAERELAEKKAHWAKEAEAAAKADPNVCQSRVYSYSGSSFRGHACSLKARYHREEHLSQWDKESPLVTRHYCQQHDEVTKNEKRRAKEAEERKYREAKWAAEERARYRSGLIAKAVGHLVELAAFLQTQEGFKKQQ